MNWTIEEIVSCFVNYTKCNWEDYVVDLNVAYNRLVQDTTTFLRF